MATPERQRTSRVLVLMPTAQDAGADLRRSWPEAGLAGAACADLDALCREIAAGAGAVLLTDEAIAGDGPAACRRPSTRQPAWSDVPLVVLTREGAEGRQASFRESANVTLVERPVRMRTLLSVVRSAPARPPPPVRGPRPPGRAAAGGGGPARRAGAATASPWPASATR